MTTLILGLTKGNGSERARAAVAIRMLGEHACEAVGALVNALEDENNKVRKHAAWALGGILSQTTCPEEQRQAGIGSLARLLKVHTPSHPPRGN